MKQLSQFFFVGLAGFAVDFGLLTVLSSSLGPYYARIASFISAVIFTWTLNRSITFRAARRASPPLQELLRYFIAMLMGGAINISLYSALISVIGKEAHHLLLAIAIGSLAGMLANFWASKKLVFRP